MRTQAATLSPPGRSLRNRLVRARGAVLLSLTAALFGGPPPAHAAGDVYTVVDARSSVRIHVGKSGLFSFAGHKHEVEAPVSGTIHADPANLEASRVDLIFRAASLRVREEGEPKGDAARVQEKMHSADVLDVLRFPEIRFVSKHVTGKAISGGYDLKVVGELTLHGLSVEFTVPVRVMLKEASLTATGRLTLRHDQFGMKPVSVGGVVKVANEVPIDFEIVAERR